MLFQHNLTANVAEFMLSIRKDGLYWKHALISTALLHPHGTDSTVLSKTVRIRMQLSPESPKYNFCHFETTSTVESMLNYSYSLLMNVFCVIPLCRCLQNYIPPQSLTLSCPVCRQTSILPEKGVAALQNNFFITNLMEVLQRDPECSRPEACNVLESASAATACQPLSCPNHEGKVS